jgi:hypothetical protein
MVDLLSGTDYFGPPAEPQFPRMRDAANIGKIQQSGWKKTSNGTRVPRRAG